MDEVVVTATRNLRSLAQVAVPTSVVGGDDIAARGAMRLADLLAEQPGLQLDYDHGAGLQVQGFAADYTLILIDGEPVVGRTAGTLDLNRFAVADVERVEVVRGPSSSLYGSEALAGVVNIITKDVRAPIEADVRARYGKHATSALSARLGSARGPWRAQAFLSRYGSKGYDLTPGTVTPTVPAFADYTGRGSVAYALRRETELALRGRVGHEQQSSTVAVAGEERSFENDARRTEWSLTPQFTHELQPGWQLVALLTGSGYRTRTELAASEGGDALDQSQFYQRYGKAEVRVRAALADKHLVTTGAGYIRETVDADRVAGERTGGFAFVQDEWTPVSWMELVPSARLDAHSDYATRLSPKLAALVRPAEGVRLRASVGSGYKAPAFRQLYLSYTNPQAGYSVFGAEEVQQGLEALEAQGQVAAYLADVSMLGGPIAPERSVALNVGVGLDLPADLGVRLNAYQNEVRDLIDTQPIARKTNGQQVFTYFNRGRVFTRGIEAELSWAPTAALDGALSYTFLDAGDRDVLNNLEAGRIYRRTESGRDVAVPVSDYAGLRGRSRHRATVRLIYRAAPLGLTASARGRYRSRYGFSDRNGNGIVDVGAEYAPGYAMLDVTLTKALAAGVDVQVGAENLTGHSNAQYVPQLSGRAWFVSLRAHL